MRVDVISAANSNIRTKACIHTNIHAQIKRQDGLICVLLQWLVGMANTDTKYRDVFLFENTNRFLCACVCVCIYIYIYIYIYNVHVSMYPCTTLYGACSLAPEQPDLDANLVCFEADAVLIRTWEVCLFDSAQTYVWSPLSTSCCWNVSLPFRRGAWGV